MALLLLVCCGLTFGFIYVIDVTPKKVLQNYFWILKIYVMEVDDNSADERWVIMEEITNSFESKKQVNVSTHLSLNSINYNDSFYKDNFLLKSFQRKIRTKNTVHRKQTVETLIWTVEIDRCQADWFTNSRCGEAFWSPLGKFGFWRRKTPG